MNTCQRCNAQIPDNATVCPVCGANNVIPGGMPTQGQPVQGMGQPPMGQPGQPPMGQPPMGQPPMGQQDQPPMGQPGQPPMGQPPMGQPPMGQPGQPPMGQPGQPPMGQPPMGQPPMGQPPMGQQGQPPMGQPGRPPMGQPGQPPMGQGGFVPPNGPGYAQPANGAPAPKKKSALPFIIIGVVALIAVIAVVAVLIVKGIIPLPGGGKSDDPNLGEWKAISAEMSGVSVDVGEAFGGDFIVDLKKGGKAGITMGDQKASAKWTLEEEEFTLKGGGLDCVGSLKNGVLTLENVLDTGINLTFEKVGGYKGESEDGSKDGAKESSGSAYFVLDLDATEGMDEELASAGEDAGYMGFERLKDGSYIYYMGMLKIDCEIKDGALLFSSGEDMGMDMDMGTVTDHGDTITMEAEGTTMVFKQVDEKPAFMNEAMYMEDYMPLDGGTDVYEPESTDRFESPTTEITYPSEWYGYARFHDFKGIESDEMMEDVWARFGTSDGGAYFEVYESPDYASGEEDPILSMYVEETEYGLAPIIGNEDAWLLDMYLLPEEAEQFETFLYNGSLDFTAEYFGEDGSCKIQFYLREQGTPWDEEYEILPPDYDVNH